MGSFLDKPKTEKTTHTSVGNGLRVVSSCMQGWRADMEDAEIVSLGVPNHPDWNFFGVFDGHGGSETSHFASQQLLNIIASQPGWSKPTLGEDDIRSILFTGFIEADKQFRLKIKSEMPDDRSGSTAICALVTPSQIIVANVGDSRCVLVRKDGSVVAMSHDHKPTNPLEADRIINANGLVMMGRVNGDLAVSRALGDYDYKNSAGLPPEKQQVSPEPEIKIVERSDMDAYLVLACDGVWDVFENDEVGAFLVSRHPYCVATEEAMAAAPAAHPPRSEEDLCLLAESLITSALEKDSRDNLSTVIVSFLPRPAAAAAPMGLEAEEAAPEAAEGGSGSEGSAEGAAPAHEAASSSSL